MRRAALSRRRWHCVPPVVEPLLFVLLIVVFVALGRSLPVRAAETRSAPGVEEMQDAPSCLDDALGHRFCAPQPTGSTVRDALGRVLCADGACVEVNGDWYCAREPGGVAGVTREGVPVCDGGCVDPELGHCEEQ